MTVQQKQDALSNALKSISKNKSLLIQKADGRMGHKFCIATPSKYGGINTLSSYMTYEEMNAYFMGMKAVLESKIDLTDQSESRSMWAEMGH